MESILLGGLALAGLNSTKEQKPDKNNIKKNKLDDKYHTNISDKMNKLEKTQASNLSKSIVQNKPEYFSQFDQLRFDNISEPVAVTDSHLTITGVNQNLQRSLDLGNGYSGVEDGLNYGVVTKENFTHNNMTPNTSKRDYTSDSDRSSRKLEAFTGVSDFWVPKQEKYHLFEPMKNLTYVNGMPVMTDYLDDRYLASSKNNNGNLPFENNVKVRPGLDGEVRQGLGTVYRVMPRDVDALRGENNQKITYENKPLETIKKGEFRGPDFNLTKYKLPDFREQKFDDLVKVRAMNEGPKQTGTFTDIITQRGDNDINYSGPAYNNNMGEGPSKNKTKFEPSKRMENYNDPTHGIVAVNSQLGYQSKNSFVNRENQRTSTNVDQPGPINKGEGGSYVIDPNYVPLTTLRELLIHGDTNIGVAGAQQTGNYVFSNDFVLPTTIRETTSHNFVLGAKGENNTGITQFEDEARKTVKQTTLSYRGGFANPTEKTGIMVNDDIARTTIRQTTSVNTPGANPAPAVSLGVVKDYQNDIAKTTTKQTTLSYRGGFANPTEKSNIVMLSDKAKTTIRQTTSVQTPGANPVSNVSQSYSKDYKDIAKTTIRQTTENNTYESGLHGVDNHAGYSRDPKEKAKPTIKQTTLYATPGMNIGFVDADGGYTRDENDKARTTIKETTHLTDYTGGLAGDVNQPMSHLATDNMTIDERRQITTYNRSSNGGKNVGGPQLNKNTVKHNLKKTSVYYVSAPGRGFDQSVTPGRTQPYKDDILENNKPQLSYGDYRTNNVFINTLKDNPLVNDIYHQKNV